MARLIDADALKEKTLAHGKKIAYVVSFLWDIEDSPTIDAIPVEWMREKMRGYASSLKSTETAALVMVMQMWQKEQEAQNDAEMSADEIAKRYLGDGKTVETTFADEEGGE